MRQFVPRQFLQPSRLIAVAVILALFFFLRFKGPSTLSSYGSHGASTLPRGFRPLNESKIAMVTFSTEQKSFTHLSLKNKACTFPAFLLHLRIN